jgi:DNA/RNA-binding domain of Phe-tRNA-synthetase-like protein
VFTDAAGQAHARRWCNRQSGLSAIQPTTTSALIVAEAMHATAKDDVARLIATIEEEAKAVWPTSPKSVTLSDSAPAFDF